MTDAVGADTEALVRAADALTNGAREVRRGAGGADRHVPPLPDDRHGLIMLIVQFDEARERFDLALADAVENAGGQLAVQAVTTADADRLVHLPEAGR